MSDVRDQLQRVREATEPNEASIQAAWASYQAGRGRRGLPVIWVGALAAAAAFAVVALLPDEPMELTLTPGLEAPLQGVAWTIDGNGLARAERTALQVDWRAGTLELDVDDRWSYVTVSTPELELQLAGSGRVRVTRDALGSAVDGEVDGRWRCAGAAWSPLEVEVSCAPRGAEGLLGRALALADAGRTEEAMAAARSGLDVAAPCSPTAGELGFQLGAWQGQAGAWDEGLATLDGYLACEGLPRADEAALQGVVFAAALGACDDARQRLAKVDDAPAVVVDRVVACTETGRSAPERAPLDPAPDARDGGM